MSCVYEDEFTVHIGTVHDFVSCLRDLRETIMEYGELVGESEFVEEGIMLGTTIAFRLEADDLWDLYEKAENLSVEVNWAVHITIDKEKVKT